MPRSSQHIDKLQAGRCTVSSRESACSISAYKSTPFPPSSATSGKQTVASLQRPRDIRQALLIDLNAVHTRHIVSVSRGSGLSSWLVYTPSVSLSRLSPSTHNITIMHSLLLLLTSLTLTAARPTPYHHHSSFPLLCPQSNSTLLSAPSSSDSYLIRCSSDSTAGAYADFLAPRSYADCASICDSHSSSNCTAWTYVGSATGHGRGRCWLKTTLGNYKMAPAGYITGSRGGSSSGGSSTTPSPSPTAALADAGATSSPTAATTASPTPSNPTCPGANGKYYTVPDGPTFEVQCGVDRHAGDMRRVRAGNFINCMQACASVDGCVDVSYVLGWCYLKSEVGFAVQNKAVWGARIVQTY